MVSTQSEKCFARKQEMYTLAEKKELEELVNKHKKKYDKKLKDVKGKTSYDEKQKNTSQWSQNKVS